MNSVCHVADGHLSLRPAWKQWLEDSFADPTVKLADAVDSAAATDGKKRHVKGLRMVEPISPAEAQEIIEFDSQFVLGISFADTA